MCWRIDFLLIYIYAEGTYHRLLENVPIFHSSECKQKFELIIFKKIHIILFSQIFGKERRNKISVVNNDKTTAGMFDWC